MRKSVGCILSLLALALVACASRPEAEINAAQEALDQAKAAGADVYASLDYQRAVDAMENAQKVIAVQDQRSALARNYAQGKRLLRTAQEEAEAAAEKASQNKEQVRGEAEGIHGDVSEAVAAAKSKLEKLPRWRQRRMKNFEELQASMQEAETSLAEAETALQSGQYMEALNGLKNARNKAESVSGGLE